MKTPLVLIIFNRPNLTETLMDIVRKIRPEKLFLISDGPRTPGEKKLVGETRDIMKSVDWKCEIFRKYSDANLGCRSSVAEGLDWVFSKVDRAIILEDDCMPDLTFFPYCEELLDTYSAENKVMMVSGNNFFQQKLPYSYAFCRHSLIWGWATWKRAWSTYSLAEKEGLKNLEYGYDKYIKLMSPIRLNAIKKTLEGRIDTWDYIWQMAILMKDGLCVFPETNLVKNAGFGKGATHTKIRTFHADLKTHSLKFPLRHPDKIEADLWFDRHMEKTYHPLFILKDALKQLFRLPA